MSVTGQEEGCII